MYALALRITSSWEERDDVGSFWIAETPVNNYTTVCNQPETGNLTFRVFFTSEMQRLFWNKIDNCIAMMRIASVA